ncbi:MAG: hypothetical protein ABIP77_10670 [Candidatus Limnocylindrales bacterium]
MAPTTALRDRLGGSKGLGVLLEAFHAEELSEDRLLELGLAARLSTTRAAKARNVLIRLHRPLQPMA